MTLLSINGLSVAFPTRRQTFVAVDGADLDVAPGEIHGLVGESGAGKSTVGAAVMGLLDPPGRITSGEITLNSPTVTSTDAPTQYRRNTDAIPTLRGKHISMIFQDPLTSLNPLFTIRQQLTQTIQAHLDVTDKEADARALKLLNDVGIPDPEGRLDNYPHQFSGGQRQRIVIALALCTEPEVIIADEPTTALDVSIQAQILQLIKDLARDRGVGVILITHDMGVIAEVTDKLTVMYRGRVVESGPTKDVLGQPQHAYTRSLIAAVPRAAERLHRFPILEYGDRDRSVDISGLARNWPKAPDPEGPMFQVTGLTKRFIKTRSIVPAWRDYLTAVDDVSFEIEHGEVFGIVGESGSGKSTVARMIAGLYAQDAGEILFEGRATSELGDAYRSEIQMIFQDPFSSLNPRMRVDAIVAEPARHHGILKGPALRDRVDELLENVGLGAEAGRKYPHEFSGGQRQRICIARALATQPRFLICDEPTSALDVSIQAQILNILKDL